MAKTKRLTKKEQKPLFERLTGAVIGGMSGALIFACENDYEPEQVADFIVSYFVSLGTENHADALLQKVGMSLMTLDNDKDMPTPLDFPNSHSSENKSSKNNNESEVH